MAHEPRCGAIGFLIAPDGTVAAVTTDGRTVFIKGATSVAGSYEEGGQTVNFNFLALEGHDGRKYLFAISSFYTTGLQDVSYNVVNNSVRVELDSNSTLFSVLMPLVSGIVCAYDTIGVIELDDIVALRFANFDLCRWGREFLTSLHPYLSCLNVSEGIYIYPAIGISSTMVCNQENQLFIGNKPITNTDNFILNCQYQPLEDTPMLNWYVANITGENLTEWQRLNAYNLIWYFGFSPSEFPWMQGA